MLELSTILERTNEQFTAHLGLANSLYVNGKLDEALKHVRACLNIAERTKSADQFLHARRLLSEISFYVAAFADCCDNANESIARYRVEDHYRLSRALGDDPKVSCLMYRALSHWILGRADLSLADCEQALALVLELGDSHSSAIAQFYASWLYALMRDAPRAEAFASRAIASCEEGGFDFWGGLARVIHGWAISSIAEVLRGIEQVRVPEADICLSCFLPWLAEVDLVVGTVDAFDHGLATMDEADELAKETFYAAERLRVRGELHAAKAASKAKAEAEEAAKEEREIAKDCYTRALKIARDQKSKAFELRTTLSMCKNGFCGVQDLKPLLEDVVGEDHDMREARMMLGLAP
jgi:tetratricopeptide (TPR) repeat protein